MSEPASFRQSWDDRVECGGATYRFGRDLPKPCVHPLLTPAGHCLTGFEMSDHVWHRGLWFAIKFVNGTNFWEEEPPAFGVQASRGQPACEWVGPDALRLTHALTWTSDATGTVIDETRVLTFRPGAIDWTCELRAAAAADLALDRTPYTTWGGYGGLSYRSSRELHDVSFLLPGGETVAALAGQRHDWCVMQAAVDGGRGQRVAVGFVDHPDNPRSPSPWYCKGANGFNYMNAAFLFHEGLNLPRGRSLRFRYRVAYRDGTWTADEFAEIAHAFRQTRENTPT